MCELHSSVSGEGPVAGSCDHGNELPGSMNDGEFLEYPSNYQLLDEDPDL
jgi:hypothetical protein